MTKTLSEKHTLLSSQMDQIIHDANAEITSLRNKVSELQVDHDSLRAKNYEMSNAIMEKARAHAKTQKDFDNLKKQMLQHDVRSAAAEAADWTPSTSRMSQHPSHQSSNYGYHPSGNVNRQHMEQIHRHQRSGSSSSGEKHNVGGSLSQRQYAQPNWNNRGRGAP
ncbi:MAG: hypothetical protein M1831_003587 [Alyxoria varia]|nr:MAG: hypothetical protein M1831_003587 [Alyxoria varia]